MTLETLERSLGQHQFCKDLGQDALHFLAGCTKNVRFSAGDHLFREGMPADWMYLIRSGQVSLETYLPGRGALTVETLAKGEVLGWSVLFAPYEWHVDGRATETVVAFGVDGNCLRNKLDADPSFGYAITRRLLREVHSRLERARLQQLDVYRAEVAGTESRGGS